MTIKMVNDKVEELYYDGYRMLVAKKDFRQGTYIMDLPVLTLPGPDMYSLEILPGIHIDCSFSAARSINHSCSPNTMVKNNAILAIACIKADDEITLDYKRTENKLAAPFDCNCGAKNCRGRIE